MNTLGVEGEKRAEAYLAAKGWVILDRSYKVKPGELDLVALDGKTLVFVEVKQRDADGLCDPSEVVDRTKKTRIAKAAAMYLQAKQDELDFDAVRFDVVAIRGEAVTHFEDAFRSPIRFTL